MVEIAPRYSFIMVKRMYPDSKNLANLTHNLSQLQAHHAQRGDEIFHAEFLEGFSEGHSIRGQCWFSGNMKTVAEYLQ